MLVRLPPFILSKLVASCPVETVDVLSKWWLRNRMSSSTTVMRATGQEERDKGGNGFERVLYPCYGKWQGQVLTHHTGITVLWLTQNLG